jgi:dihydrofolate reductase
MPTMIYDVAVSIDGYISGPSGDISRFPHQGPVVVDYVARLQTYQTAIMGRGTYEFGYAHGMTPGQNPYPHMSTFVFSSRLKLPGDAVTVLNGDLSAEVARLRRCTDGDIYLCGGGVFAAACLTEGLIDRLVLKRAPILLGGGTPLFTAGNPHLRHIETTDYGNGTLLQVFDVLKR